VKTDPSVTGVGLVKSTTVLRLTRPVLSLRIDVTMSGAPLVIVVAVETFPVFAVSPVVGTKLKAVSMGTARAGPAFAIVATNNAPTSAVRKLRQPMSVLLSMHTRPCAMPQGPTTPRTHLDRMQISESGQYADG
jgi:hypothetical protein